MTSEVPSRFRNGGAFILELYEGMTCWREKYVGSCF